MIFMIPSLTLLSMLNPSLHLVKIYDLASSVWNFPTGVLQPVVRDINMEQFGKSKEKNKTQNNAYMVSFTSLSWHKV